VDVIVTTAGGIEEDLIKCLAPTYRGDFSLPGAVLRSKGLNRIGNLLVPNDNYCKFENWIMPLFDQMLLEQSTEVKIPTYFLSYIIFLPAERNLCSNTSFYLPYTMVIRDTKYNINMFLPCSLSNISYIRV
jgi:deoxyhypusine synthase